MTYRVALHLKSENHPTFGAGADSALKVGPIRSELMESSTRTVIDLYRTKVRELTDQGITGAADKVAKGPSFNTAVLGILNELFSEANA